MFACYATSRPSMQIERLLLKHGCGQSPQNHEHDPAVLETAARRKTPPLSRRPAPIRASGRRRRVPPVFLAALPNELNDNCP